LQADVEQLQGEAQNLELQPADLVTGSIELLNEVSAGKITGEEERYSRTDLFDIQRARTLTCRRTTPAKPSTSPPPA
jgi:iron uptake system EfeUOB component EfeO/EfeM